MTVSLKLNTPRRTLFITICFFAALTLLAINISVDLYIRHCSRTFRAAFTKTSGYVLDFDTIHFDIFRGITLKNLSIKSAERPLARAQHVAVGLDFVKLIAKQQLRCTRVFVFNGVIYSDAHRSTLLQPFFLQVLKEGGDFLQSTKINLVHCTFDGVADVTIDGYIAIAQEKLLLTRGKVFINSASFLAANHANPRNGLLNKRIDYAFEASFSDSSFTISKLDIRSDELHCIASGIIENHNDAFQCALQGNIRNVLLEDIQPLNNGLMRTHGIINADFAIKGPIENVLFEAEVNIENGSLSIFDALTIRKIHSHVAWDNNWFKIKEMSATIDNAPVAFTMAMNTKKASRFEAQFTGKRLGPLRDIAVLFDGVIQDKVLLGNTSVDFSFTQRQKNYHTSFSISNLNLNFIDRLYGIAHLVTGLEEVQSVGSPGPRHKLEAYDLTGRFGWNAQAFSLALEKASFYQGVLHGKTEIKVKDADIIHHSNFELENVAVVPFLKEFLPAEQEPELSGVLNGSLTVTSDEKKPLEGTFQIKDGSVKNNAILEAVADFFSIPSLRSIDFSQATIDFKRNWERYNAEMSFISPALSLSLQTEYFPDDKIDGTMFAQIPTSKMDESPRFHRLFKYIEYKEPTVYFPFLLKGYAKQPRIEWMQSEFKEKLQNFLSEKYKKILQEELNKLFEKGL